MRQQNIPRNAGWFFSNLIKKENQPTFWEVQWHLRDWLWVKLLKTQDKETIINLPSMGGGGAAARSQKQNNYEKDFAPETAQPGEEETRHRGHNGRGQHTGCRGKGETPETCTDVRSPEILAEYDSAGKSPGGRSQKKFWEKSHRTKGNKCYKN